MAIVIEVQSAVSVIPWASVSAIYRAQGPGLWVWAVSVGAHEGLWSHYQTAG